MAWFAAALLVLACACASPPARLEVPPATRLVVVAPHPDDETLAAGGLVQRVLREGGSVRIVVLTAGDGFLEAAAGASGHAEPSADDYRLLGRIRAGELRAAVRALGVEDLVLLDGPDGGLDALWRAHRAGDPAYVSPLSGRGPFRGADLLRALSDALDAAAPSLVVAPDPRDHHADHAAAGRFALAAIATLATPPLVLGYLVHDTVWPPPHPPGDVLPPPAAPEYAATRWVSFRLAPDEIATKRTALAAYRSQQPTLGGLLERFVRRNEVFAVQAN